MTDNQDNEMDGDLTAKVSIALENLVGLKHNGMDEDVLQDAIRTLEEVEAGLHNEKKDMEALAEHTENFEESLKGVRS